jgi:hypothetical protein
MKPIALALFGAVLLAGCMTDEPIDESVETSASINPYFPYIPPPLTTYRVAYFVFDDSPSGCAAEATDANIRAGLQNASDTWASSNVRFTLSSITRIHAPRLQYLGSPTKWPMDDEMAAELSPMLGMGGGLYLWLAASGSPQTSEGWLAFVAAHPAASLTIYVPCAEAAGTSYGEFVSGGAHVPAAYVATSLVAYFLGLTVGVY